MNKRIPIRAARDLAKEFKLDQVIIVAYERDVKAQEHQTHVVTYGKTKVDCLQAAQGGNVVKKALGWPEKLAAMPSRNSEFDTILGMLKNSAVLKNFTSVGKHFTIEGKHAGKSIIVERGAGALFTLLFTDSGILVDGGGELDNNSKEGLKSIIQWTEAQNGEIDAAEAALVSIKSIAKSILS